MLPDELIETLTSNESVRIERIVSTGHTTPEGFWYDSDQHEWVTVLRGEAKLLFEGDSQPLHLVEGDHVMIPAHTRHRVTWTSTTGPTVWLAVYFCETASP